MSLTKAQRLYAHFANIRRMKVCIIPHNEAEAALRGMEMLEENFVSTKDKRTILRVGNTVRSFFNASYDEFKKHNYTIYRVSGLRLKNNKYQFAYSKKEVQIKHDNIKILQDLIDNKNKEIQENIIAEIEDENGFAIIKKAEKYLVSNNRLFTGKMRFIALERGDFKCCFCGKTAKDTTLEVDHIIPYSQGGLTSILNSRVVCPDCNKGIYHATQKK